MAQDTLQVAPKSNPIIYTGINIGSGIAGLKGLLLGGEINYQAKAGLFTARLNGMLNFEVDQIPFVPFPLVHDHGYMREIALLYGLRHIKNGRSLSISAGVSQVMQVAKYKDEDGQRLQVKRNYVGLPFELNILWFKSDKQRWRLFHLIPIGKPTGFGSSYGFKLSGNVSKNSYLALGAVVGLGYHKHY